MAAAATVKLQRVRRGLRIVHITVLTHQMASVPVELEVLASGTSESRRWYLAAVAWTGMERRLCLKPVLFPDLFKTLPVR